MVNRKAASSRIDYDSISGQRHWSEMLKSALSSMESEVVYGAEFTKQGMKHRSQDILKGVHICVTIGQ